MKEETNKKPYSKKGKPQGQKKGLSPVQISYLKERLKSEGPSALRDRVLLYLGLDTMLRTSDLLNLKVGDVTDFKGNIKHEVYIQIGKKRKKQKPKPHTILIHDETRKLLKEYIKEHKLYLDDYIFYGRFRFKPIVTRTHAETIKRWMENYLGLDKGQYSTHSIRRTRAEFLFKNTMNFAFVSKRLGHSSIESTKFYVGFKQQECLEMDRNLVL